MAGWLGATSSVIFRFLLRQRDCNGNGKPRGCVPQSLCLCSTPCSFLLFTSPSVYALYHLVHQLLSPPHTVCEQGVRNRQTFLLFFFLLRYVSFFTSACCKRNRNTTNIPLPPPQLVVLFLLSFVCISGNRVCMCVYRFV